MDEMRILVQFIALCYQNITLLVKRAFVFGMVGW